MIGKKVPVTLSGETNLRLEALFRAVKTCVTPTASRAVSRSAICDLAIRELLDRYEAKPVKLASKLGFSTRPQQ